MKFTAKRLLGAGVIGIAAIVTPLALTVALPGVGSAPSSVAGAQAASDVIQFNQSAAGADSFQFVTANGVQSPLQAANISGNCATPTGGGAAILGVCGYVYPSVDYSGTPKQASLGTSGPATGVNGVSPAWTIDNKTSGNKTNSDAIDFTPGDPGTIGPNRMFTDAQIPVQRKDNGVAIHSSINVELAEYSSTVPTTAPSSANLIGKQDCTLTGGQGALLTVDPNSCGVAMSAPAGVPATNGVPDTFATIEVRDLTNSTSISVVGPTATFDLATQICGGQSINTPPASDTVDNPGGVYATLTLTGDSSQCKTYTSFTSVMNNNLPTLSFNGLSTGAVQFTIQVTWPVEALCSPYADSATSLAPGGTTGVTDVLPPAPTPVVGGAVADQCPLHQFQFNTTPFTDQGYCQTAVAPPPAGTAVELQQQLCTVTK
jgi:hypothetical protein